MQATYVSGESLLFQIASHDKWCSIFDGFGKNKISFSDAAGLLFACILLLCLLKSVHNDF